MSALTGTGWVKKTGVKLKTFFTSKDVLSFILFLLLSTAFWFVHTLDRERQNIIKLPVNYVGIPNDIEIKNKLPNQITVTIRDEGIKLLQYANRKLTPINIDLTRVYFSKGKIIISPDQLKSKLSNYFLPTTAVLEIAPDSLVVVYQKLATKDLPIKMYGNLQLAQQHILSDSIRYEPSHVKVFGPKHILDTMLAAYTEKINLKNISDTTQLQVKLQSQQDIRYAFNDVSIGIFVEMFTEDNTEIPITIINTPSNLQVRIFPVSVKLAYNVGLSNYKKVSANDIKVVFDYNDVVDSQKRKNKLKIINNSPYLSNLRIDPDEVEFLLEKK
ncbi:MAG: hypothetical protein QM751_06325 [Paludibacteraceae bacterium]